MARIVNTETTPLLSFILNTHHYDGTVTSKELPIDSMVENLRYVEDNDVKSVSGRVAGYTHKYYPKTHNYVSPTKLRSFFKEDVEADTIIIDASTEYHSNLYTIPCKELLEDDTESKVERMSYILTFGIELTITLSDLEDGDLNKDTYIIHEGDSVKGLTYLYRGSEMTVSGKIVAITVATKSLAPVNFILLQDKQIYTIPVKAVKSIEDVVEPLPEGTNVTDAIAYTDTGIVALKAGKFEDPIAIRKDVKLVGANLGINAEPRYKTGTAAETVISGKITVAPGVKVEIDGVTLTKDAYLDITGASEFTLKNTIVKGIIPNGNKSYYIRNSAMDSTKIVIQDCAFENNVVNGTGSVYNLFELNSVLLDGSIISGCHFSEGCATHNDINIYDVADGAAVTITRCVWEKSDNGIRIGTKGNRSAVINISDCMYLKTDEKYPEYAGLLLVQPYGKATISMENLEINLSKIVHNDKLQLYYLYSGGGDTKFTDYNVPTISVDGVIEVAPLRESE